MSTQAIPSNEVSRFLHEMDSFEKFVDQVIEHKSLLCGEVFDEGKLIYPIEHTILNCLVLKETGLDRIKFGTEAEVQIYSSLLDRIHCVRMRLQKERDNLQKQPTPLRLCTYNPPYSEEPTGYPEIKAKAASAVQTSITKTGKTQPPRT